MNDLEKEPHVPTGLQIGEVTGENGITLGILTFYTDEGEISFYINEEAVGILQGAIEKLQLLLSNGGTA
ncbi:hypothetical protein [Chelativorans salis]|uniref:Uncharacterized protein n=1 Tax=Chelativorans salis TaxID=2978478 RepID=A0ABT2LS02_9HYPH|nr:hypothetical protein [Chelativorans sp. EGI FJ00035]MCT7377305.1 hypothetical protein [Chelativorans sp. EGI FJ00035]